MRGLTSDLAREALARFGLNALPAPERRSLSSRVVAQLKSALIYVLLFALAVDLLAWALSGWQGVPLEALAILAIVVLNTSLGVLQEYRSEQALKELQRLGAPRAWVLRDGAFERIDASEIVPGDVVRLEAGDRVPADGRAEEVESLRIDESVLTGESLPVDKAADDDLFSGTVVAHGRGTLLVTQTGLESSMGKLAGQLNAIDTTRTPLERRVDELGRGIARSVAVLCLLVVAAAFTIEGWDDPMRVLMFAVAFGVAVVPEGMPAMMTMALAFGVQRMARRKAVVRRLAAVEALGSVTVIATDKTGTLTENRLTVQELQTAPGCENDALCAMVLANDADAASGAGDPLEVALIEHARARGTDAAALQRAFPRLASRGFDSQWRCMRVTVVGPGGEQIAYLKGAPEAIVERCTLEPAEKRRILERVEGFAREGLKVLGLARGAAHAEERLTFLGLVGLVDPPRKEARSAVLAARRAGVRVLMVTGDHAATARAIARAVGIDDARVVEGAELGQSELDDDRAVASCNVFARMQPGHKLRLIERLQAAGAVVAMTGDGLNDAPALKRADIGVAMGERGSEIAREVADVVLLDDNFSTIVAAIEEGRRIYANVQAFVRFSLSSNVALVLLVLGAGMGSLLLGLRTDDGALLLPFTALQILWINFLGDGPPALAMARDSAKDALLERPRAPSARLLDGVGARFVVADGLLKGGIGLSLLVALPALGASTASTATAVFFYEGIAKLLSMFPARRLAGRLAPNGFVLGASAVSVALQVSCIAWEPLRNVLGLVPLSGSQIGVVVLALAATLGVGELILAILRAHDAGADAPPAAAPSSG